MANEDNIIPSSLDETIQVALSEALAMCERLSADAKKCAAAWEAVKALQEEANASCTNSSHKTAFEAYCDAYPNAIECQFIEGRFD